MEHSKQCLLHHAISCCGVQIPKRWRTAFSKIVIEDMTGKKMKGGINFCEACKSFDFIEKQEGFDWNTLSIK